MVILKTENARTFSISVPCVKVAMWKIEKCLLEVHEQYRNIFKKLLSLNSNELSGSDMGSKLWSRCTGYGVTFTLVEMHRIWDRNPNTFAGIEIDRICDAISYYARV